MAHLCDGRDNCADGSDETALELQPGILNLYKACGMHRNKYFFSYLGKINNCSQPMSPCVSISKQWWLDDEGREGVRCDGDTCLDRTKVCDGRCDCPKQQDQEAGCLDEDEDVCLDWKCSQGFFKCFSTGK